MPRELVIVVTETDHGFQATIPGRVSGHLRYSGFGVTIPVALRDLGTHLVETKEYLRAAIGRGSYADVFQWLSLERSEHETRATQ